MIGKLLKWFKKEPEKKQPKSFSLSKEKFISPTYPPDLAELFSDNRTETHTDSCLWHRVEEDK